MLPEFKPLPPADERDARFDAAAVEFAAPLARLAGALEDEYSGCEALLQDIHVALWRSFADFDESIPWRTWVLRVALHSVAGHRPNTQDKDVRSMTVREAWASRRRRGEFVSLDEVAIGELRSPSGLIHRLKPLDRELVVLYLEGVTAEEAREIGGWPVDRVQAAYEQIGRLLLPGSREAWQQRAVEVQPVSRFLVHSRIGDLRTRGRRESRSQLMAIPLLTAMAVFISVSRGRWIAPIGLALLAAFLIEDAWRLRRRSLAEPAPGADARLDSLSLHRRQMERELEELRRRWGWRAWALSIAGLIVALSYPLERGTGWTWPIVITAALGVVLAARWLADLKQAKRLSTGIEGAS
jgi:RNA polymerase sigma-70 factor (ECF subfamily)